MKQIAKELKKSGIKLHADHAIGALSSFKIGGKAALFVVPKNEDELSEALSCCVKRGAPYMAAGSLSNVVLPDTRLNMVLFSMKENFSEAKLISKTKVMAGAGMTVNAFNMMLAKHGLAGAEFLAGIPGTIGGAIYMNAGAFGKTVSGIVTKVFAVNKKGKKVIVSAAKCGFAYRKSIFQKNGFIITGAEFSLKKGNKKAILDEIKKIVKMRHDKHPSEPSAGSFFKNNYPVYIAGKVIEDAGLKGKQIGGAAISEKHANFIVNKGNAKASDVKKLAAFVKKEVYKKFKIKLQEEVRYI